MSIFLMAWNPKKWKWDEMDNDIEEIQKKGFTECVWSCGSKQPVNGDLFFIVMVGTKNNGIFGSGIIDSLEKDVISDVNQSKTNKIHGKINVLLNPQKENILNVKLLNEVFSKEKYSKIIWEPQKSGIRINDSIHEQLKDLWIDFLKTKNKKYKFIKKEYLEGNEQQKLYTYKERNSAARDECINHYGYKCQICEKSMYDLYGDFGKELIHVHHINFISNTSGRYKIDPINDLVTVCPNCHSILHKKYNGKFITVEELRNYCKKNPNFA